MDKFLSMAILSSVGSKSNSLYSKNLPFKGRFLNPFFFLVKKYLLKNENVKNFVKVQKQQNFASIWPFGVPWTKVLMCCRGRGVTRSFLEGSKNFSFENNFFSNHARDRAKI